MVVLKSLFCISVSCNSALLVGKCMVLPHFVVEGGRPLGRCDGGCVDGSVQIRWYLLSLGSSAVGKYGAVRIFRGVMWSFFGGIVGMGIVGSGFRFACFAMLASLNCIVQRMVSISISALTVWIWLEWMGLVVIVPWLF